MTAKFNLRDNVLYAVISGELDHHSIKPIRDETDIEILRHSPKALVIDFKNITFMDSSGIGYIMGRTRLIPNITIINANPSIKKIMVLSGIGRIADIK
ncbi:MAG: STAS domain-containing protein [Oscillospiraceae bacterium]